jgi:hypothetical protein
MIQMMAQLICGYDKDCHANSLRPNELFKSTFGKTDSQPTHSHLIKSATPQMIEQLNRLILDYIGQYYRSNDIKTIVMDIDSTHSIGMVALTIIMMLRFRVIKEKMTD